MSSRFKAEMLNQEGADVAGCDWEQRRQDSSLQSSMVSPSRFVMSHTSQDQQCQFTCLEDSRE